MTQQKPQKRDAVRQERIVYIMSGRLPTEKAHGYQIMQMCEALANTGAEVELWYPHRHQKTEGLRGVSPFDYYAIEPRFRVRELFSTDVLMLEDLVPKPIVRFLFVVQQVIWGLSVAIRARMRLGFGARGAASGVTLLYTRDVLVAFWFLMFNLPLVFEAHAIPGRYLRGVLRPLARLPSLRLVVGLTPFIEAELQELGVPRDKLLVWGDAVSTRRFVNLPSREDAREHLGLPSRCPIVGYVGRFQTMGQEKGLETLIRCMRFVHDAFPDALLICVGGPLASVDSYRGIADDEGVDAERLLLLDHVPSDAVPLWLRAFDVAVVPFPDSHHFARYASPLKLFEYMAAGNAIVASDLPTIRTVLSDDAVILVPPGDPKALAKGICRLFGNEQLRANLSARAAYQAQSYTWDRRAREIVAAARHGDGSGF